jgi:predicted HTH domain antitoxin
MQITLDIPEQYLVDRSPGEWGKHIKLYAALLMFAAGELSAGAAAELGEVDRFTFVEACRKHAIPVVDYSPEDLRAEVESLRRAS